MKTLFVSILIFSFSAIGFAQKSYLVGFGCGYVGSSTEKVMLMEKLLYDSKFDSIRGELYSNNSAIQSHRLWHVGKSPTSHAEIGSVSRAVPRGEVRPPPTPRLGQSHEVCHVGKLFF